MLLAQVTNGKKGKVSLATPSPCKRRKSTQY
jgi:hypothetical protein